MDQANTSQGRFCSLSCSKLAYHGGVEGQILRFAQKVNKSDECWLWIGPPGRSGYGRFNRTYAHRAAWRIATGKPIPTGLKVLHTCDVRVCVRNDDVGTYEVNGMLYERRGHLWLGTQAANMADMAAKGRAAMGDRNAARLYPERLARGDRNGSRLHPESVQRGERHKLAKLTTAQVREIRARYAAGGILQIHLAREYGVGQPTISAIVLGRAWPDTP